MKKSEKNEDIVVEQHDLEKALSVAEKSPFFLFRMDLEGHVVDLNPKAEKLFQQGGAYINQLQHIFPDLHLKDLVQLIREGKEHQLEVSIRDKVIAFHLVGLPEMNLVNAYGIDVTSQKTLQESIMQNSRLLSLGELTAGLGHEISNPLAVIAGCMELLKMDNESPCLEDKSVQLDAIDRAVKKITKVICGIRSYAKAEQQKAEIFELRDTVETAVAMLGKIYENAGARLIIEIPEESIKISGVVGKVQEVLLSLLTNAKDAVCRNGGGEVRIRILARTDQAFLEVSDTGSGIPREVQKHMFEPFYSAKMNGKGSGLGLSAVKRVVEEMHASLEYSSDSEGTRFTVGFDRVIENENSKCGGRKPCNGLRALVVEDETTLGRFIQVHLKNYGLEADFCENGAEALELIQKNYYDYVFSDIFMPEMNGYDLLREVRETELEVGSFIFVSGGCPEGYEEEEDDETLEPDAMVLKPFCKEEIFELVDEFHPKKTAA